MIFWVEFGLALAAVAVGFALPWLGSRWFEAIECTVGRLAARPRLAVLTVGLTALAARAALLPILPIPQPAIHDEFSYLLAADTFAHGRMTNPTHPLWIYFETFHEIMRPTYASMYPPAQGLVLAFGQVVLGHPFWGVWLSLGLMCAALCWMLQGWLPPQWAFLAGMLAVIRLATFSYWANSYWGGAVAATGGALVYGALPRLRKTVNVADALLLALGVSILANSRPYEGLIFSLPVAAALLAFLVGKNRPPFRESFRRLVLPAGLLLGVVAVLTSYYFWRVTGSPFRMPQSVNRQTYAVAPYFIGQALQPTPVYHHAVIKDFYTHYELQYWKQTRTLGSLVRLESGKMFDLWTFYLEPLLTLPLLLAVAALPYGFGWRQISPSTRFLLVATVFGLAGYTLEVFFSPQYAAPAACLAYAFVAGAMRSIRGWKWREKTVGVGMTRFIPAIAGMLLLLAAVGGTAFRSSRLPLTWCSPEYYSELQRAQLLARLQREPGRHLLIVRYSPGHQPQPEWVYNDADIDASKVVWARDMGRQQNVPLLTYFKGRRVWLVEPDVSPPRLSAYPAEANVVPPGT
jgi:hypothetical protein